MIQAWLTDSKIMFFFMFTSSDRGLAIPWQDKGAERKSNDGISLLYHLIRYEVKDMLLVAVNISPNCNKCSGELCELHGGSLVAEVHPEGGMLFKLRLPIKKHAFI
ncbi:hypothetical protein [Serratia quinivorans]|uniref:hypothetical protein n=1 Tax=Serratia quinivorans TaxID=137545 RepID=UPI0021BDC30D|nr:hypothetical protein [Serratia quinivorans]